MSSDKISPNQENYSRGS